VQVVQFAREDKPKFTGRRHCHSGTIGARCGKSEAARHILVGARASSFGRTAGGGMSKSLLISVVEDDQFFRESMRRLMRSLGYTVEAFSSAVDFLASPRVSDTACLIADVHMPAMTGVELYRRLIDTGHTIPTILVTAYPNDVDRDRALKDGVVCYLRKPIDEQNLVRCLRAALTSSKSSEESS
jgi:FixJ family two-component response regulator